MTQGSHYFKRREWREISLEKEYYLLEAFGQISFVGFLKSSNSGLKTY